MTEEERLKYLEKVEKTAIELIKCFNNTVDYVIWDEAVDKLEAALKEKPK